MSEQESAPNYKEYWNSSQGDGGYYLRNAQIWDAAPVANDIKRVLRFLEDHPDVSTILDTACGTGRLFPHIQKWNCTGIEWSDTFYPAVVNNKYGIKIHKKDLRHEKLDTTFDLVLNTQVLLHIPPQYIKGAISNLLEMTGKYLMIITWQDGLATHKSPGAHVNQTGNSGSDVGSAGNSFSHDYDQIFNELDVSFTREVLTFQTHESEPWADHSDAENFVYLITK